MSEDFDTQFKDTKYKDYQGFSDALDSEIMKEILSLGKRMECPLHTLLMRTLHVAITGIAFDTMVGEEDEKHKRKTKQIIRNYMIQTFNNGVVATENALKDKKIKIGKPWTNK